MMKFKYILNTIFLLGLSANLMAQAKPFTLSGKISGQNPGFLKLSYPTPDGKFVIDSAVVKNGAFSFRGELLEPAMVYITGAVKTMSMDDPNGTNFFLSPGDMKLVLTAGDFKNYKLRGSSVQDEYFALNKLKYKINQEMKPFSEAYQKANNAYREAIKAQRTEAELEALKEKANNAKEKMDPFYARLGKVDLGFIKSNPDSYLSAYLMRYKVSGMPLVESKALFAAFSPKIKNSSYGREIQKEIKGLEGGSPGSPAFVFSSTDINGEQLSLADFKGEKYVLVDFWASWCVPCRKGNPHLLSLYSKYKDKGFEIIGVSDDDSNHAAWKKAVDQDKIGVWKHVLRGLKRTASGYDKSNDISGPYGIHSLPTKILIDKDGMIIGRYGGGGENDEAMDKKLASIFN